MPNPTRASASQGSAAISSLPGGAVASLGVSHRDARLAPEQIASGACARRSVGGGSFPSAGASSHAATPSQDAAGE